MDPGQRSDEVFLIQPYDGGGYSIPPVTNWFLEATSQVAAATQQLVHTVVPNELFRIIGCGVQRVAGAVYTLSYLQVKFPQATFNVQISNDLLTVDGNERGFNSIVCPVVPAGTEIRVFASGGDAASQFTATLIGVSVPVGTVFYV